MNALARLLPKSWFADIDYPATEDAEWKESEHSRSPSGTGEGGQFTAGGGGATSLAEARATHAALLHQVNTTPVAQRPPDLVKKLQEAWQALRAARGGAKPTKGAKPMLSAPHPAQTMAKAAETQAKAAETTAKKAPTAPAPSSPDAIGQGVSHGLQSAGVPGLKHHTVKTDKAGNTWVSASTALTSSGHPVTLPGEKGSAGIAVKLNHATKTAHFYEINNGTKTKGLGAKMVEGVLGSMPDDYKAKVHVDLSGGFWEKIEGRHPDRFTADAGWNEGDHPRVPAGSEGGGEFTAGGGGGGAGGASKGGGGAYGWKATVPAAPGYVKGFSAKIDKAIAAHLGEPHELIPQIKEIATAHAHNPNNITYANKVLKHLAGAAGLPAPKAKVAPKPAAPTPGPKTWVPPSHAVPDPVAAEAAAAKKEAAAAVTESIPLPPSTSGLQNQFHKIATGPGLGGDKAEQIDYLLKINQPTQLTEAYGKKLIAILEGKTTEEPDQSAGLTPHGEAPKPAAKAPDLPKPHAGSQSQEALYNIATDPSTTTLAKLEGLANHPTVKGYPDGFSAKYANALQKAIAEAAGIIPSKPEAAAPTPAKPKPTPKTITNVHGRAKTNQQNHVAAKSTRADAARKIENLAKQPKKSSSADAVACMPSLNSAFWKGATPEAKSALNSYSGSGYQHINGSLRGAQEIQPTSRKMIDAIDHEFTRDEAYAAEHVIVRRGEHVSPEMLASWRKQIEKGHPACLHTHTGYVSASAADEPASIGANKNCWFHFTVRKGANVLGISGLVGHLENEVIFPHGQQSEIYEMWEAGGKTHVKAYVK